MIKFIKWFLIGILVLFVLVLGAGFIVAYFYEDEVKEYVINELNKQLKTEVNVSDIEFSIFTKFPNATLDLSDVVANSTEDFNKHDFENTNTDTLFAAKHLYLKFNVFDILAKNYKLKAIDISDGQLNLFIDKKGKDNFHFWIEDTSSVESDFKMNMQKLIFNKIGLKFYNKAKDLQLHTYTDRLVLAGDLTSDSYSMGTYGSFIVYEFYYDDVNYFKSKDVFLNLDLNVTNNHYNISSGSLEVEDLKFNVSGKITADTKNSIDLKIDGTNLSIQSFLSLLPEKYKKDIKKFESSGLFFFNASISGEVDNIQSPHIETNFGIENGIIERSGSKIKLTDVGLKGYYSNGTKNNSITTILSLDDFDVKIGGGHFSGNFRMENLKKPKIELAANGEIELFQLKEFFEIDTLEVLKGDLKADFVFNGTLNDIADISVNDMRYASTEGKIGLTNGELVFKDSPYRFDKINGDFTFKDNDLNIDSLGLIINDNDFIIQGYFGNILSYLLIENQKLAVKGKIFSESVDIVKLFNMEAESSDSDASYSLPDNITIDAGISIDKFKLDRFIANSVNGKIKYRNKTLAASPVTFKTMDGDLKATGTFIQNQDDSFSSKIYVTLTRIDIKKLFYTFKNFSQDFIKEEHLKGLISATVSYSSDWSRSLSVDEESIVVDGDIKIEDGELIDFEPMERLSKYIELEELRHIKFATLENDILIKNKKLTIPSMEIKSSAFDIEVSGNHTFDNRIDYRLKVLLSDFLSKKAKKAKKENSEFGVIEDDGLGRTSLYLSITGTVDDYKISYDTKNVIQHIKEEFHEEKKNLKVILNEEFGWFKKDSAVIKAKDDQAEEQVNTNFTFTWDDEDEEVENKVPDEEDEW